MKNEQWIDSGTACVLLGVRPQTLYAYVSRKLLRACSDQGDARRSLYSRRDVEELASRHRRPRARKEIAAKAMRWGDPVLDTAVSGVRDGTLYFGSRSATECATDMTLEEVSAHHWRAPVNSSIETPVLELSSTSPLERAVAYLAAHIGNDRPVLGRSRDQIGREGSVLISSVTDAIIGRSVSGPIHTQLARVWELDREKADIVRSALVLLSDHELNPSTFAVRVCTSTGASLTAAILAGMVTLSGSRHGGVARKADEALKASLSGSKAVEEFLQRNTDLSPYAFGYGHPLYPAGDPRGSFLLASLPSGSPAVQGVWSLAKYLGVPPNIDAALAACVNVLGLPENAAFSIFAIGRLSGWIAHAIEQSQTHHMIRPRARFLPVE